MIVEPWTKNVLALIAVGVVAFVFAANPTITSVMAQQRYPQNGKIDAPCKVTGNIAGMTLTNGLNTILKKNEEPLKGVKPLGGVQLWENGPYWAECNVGATKPEEFGYYFSWSDTVGYRRSGEMDDFRLRWVSSDGGYTSDNPFVGYNHPTCAKTISELRSSGYIDSTGNLVAKYDAATAHLGAPWRMPTAQEFADLTNNCTTTHTTRHGVPGRLVTGKGAYVSKSIFLPEAGEDAYGGIFGPGKGGYYWSSTPDSDSSDYAGVLCFYMGNFGLGHGYRPFGQTVRPLRDFDK